MPVSLPSEPEETSIPVQSDWEAQADPDGAELELESSEAITEPFDPAQIRVNMWAPTIDLLMTRIREGEIDLVPEFQRQGGLWSDPGQSRLIESILIRIPLPVFYM